MIAKLVAAGAALAGVSCTSVPRPGSTLAEAGMPAVGGKTPPVDHHTLTLDDGSVLRYSVIPPSGAAPLSGRWPLVLVLHYGAPHDSTPPYYGQEVLERLVRPAFGDLPAIFVAPDAPGRGWADARSERAVLALLNHLRTSMPIDQRRTLVIGYSVGGMGVWFFVARHPELFRVALAIASFPMLREGRTAADRASQLRAMALDSAAIWTAPFREIRMYIIHSRQDELMPFAAIEQTVALLCAHGGHVEFARLDSVTHQQTGRYVEPLRAAIPWIERQWSFELMPTLRVLDTVPAPIPPALPNERCS